MIFKKYFPYLILGVILCIIYRAWFFNINIIGGDWPFFFDESKRNLPLFVPSWISWQGNGLGGTNPAYFIQTYQFLTFFIANHFSFSWEVTARIFWFGLFLVISPLSLIFLLKTIQREISLWTCILGGLIYTTNTYILMVTSGGQMGVALAYAFAPLVIAYFIKLIIKNENKVMFLTGLFLGIQTALDPRISYTTIFIAGLIFIFHIFQLATSSNKHKITQVAIMSLRMVTIGLITLLLNLFWLLPLLIYGQNPIDDLGSAYSSVTSLKFFSFAQLPQSLSLLHPNWPDNIFGKVSFMKPEFILLPIVVYFSLFFLGNKSKVIKEQGIIILFVFLGLFGAFLAKGANLPFGEVYIWMFENIPGFVMFRDPTKWYILVAVSFSVLIPLSLSLYIVFFSKYVQLYKATIIVLLLFIITWISLIRNVFYPGLGGTFSSTTIPSEYIELKNMLVNEQEFFRILWVPRLSRFGYTSFNHPSIEGQFLMNATNSAEFTKAFAGPDIQQTLADMSVKYVVIPYDSQKEIFLEDRKYNHRERKNIESVLDNVSWLTKIREGNMVVYKTPGYNEHFWLESGENVNHQMISPDSYEVEVKISQPTRLVFSENYNSYWVAKVNDNIIHSEKYKNKLNSFYIENAGDYVVNIYYQQRDYYTYGRSLSFATFLLTSVSIIVLSKKTRDRKP